jgi:hypothetical protein
VLAQVNDHVNQDLKADIEIFAVYRSEAHRQRLEALGCTPVQLDIKNLQAVKDFIADHQSEG